MIKKIKIGKVININVLIKSFAEYLIKISDKEITQKPYKKINKRLYLYLNSSFEIKSKQQPIKVIKGM